MFTGIVTDVGSIREITKLGDTRFEIETGYNVEEIDIGSSIACSGPCLTVVEKGKGWFAVEVSSETLAKTTLKDWTVGTKINLERSMRVGDELGGHIVSGHIDTVISVLEQKPEGDSTRIIFEYPPEYKRYIASKGSVSLNGVSLTINEVGENFFGVNVISHTQKVTSFGSLEPGDRVNMEIDTIARYVARLLERDGNIGGQ